MSKLIQSLEESNLKVVSESLAMAFMNDPLERYVFPDAEERKQKSPDHFATVLRYGLAFGEAYELPNSEGAVVWLPPGKTDITPEKAERGGLTKMPELIGYDAALRFFIVSEYLKSFHITDAPGPHWYTMVIGVAPASCGRGYGKALMQPIIEKAKAAQTPIYLETFEQANIQFYTKLGFRVVRELIEPVSNLPVWTFLKD